MTTATLEPVAQSLAEQLAALAPAERAALLRGMSPEESEALLWDWKFWARPNQLAPDGEWLAWLVLAGRGFGKTRLGAQWAVEKALATPNVRIALVAETYSDGRDTMVEGESGLLACLRPHQLRGGTRELAWNRSLGELFLHNGSSFKIFSSEKPGSLRGPQHHFAWGDEPMKWKDAHKGAWADETTWWNMLFGLRLGDHPQVVLTSTPKRVRLLVGDKQRPGLLNDSRVVVTRGSSKENLVNLAPSYKANIIDPLLGTRLGRQEIDAEVLEDVEGALWTMAMIEADRCAVLPEDLERIVVAIDPAVTSKASSDWTGIIVAGKGLDGEGYVFDDRSVQASSEVWARRAVAAYREWEADRIVGEVNNGGDLVERVVRLEDSSVSYSAVRASRGKVLRAEPIQALYEKHRIHHVGALVELEDQMTTWVPAEGDSPDRLDALVWALTELFIDGADKPSVW